MQTPSSGCGSRGIARRYSRFGPEIKDGRSKAKNGGRRYSDSEANHAVDDHKRTKKNLHTFSPIYVQFTLLKFLGQTFGLVASIS